MWKEEEDKGEEPIEGWESEEELAQDNEEDEEEQDLSILNKKLDAFLEQRLANMKNARAKDTTLLRAGSFKYFLRGADAKPNEDQNVVHGLKKLKVSKWDVLLKQFKYQESLDAVMAMRNASVIVPVLDKLIRRDSLDIALKNRDEKFIAEFLEFIRSNFNKIQYSRTLMVCLNRMVELYEHKFDSVMIHPVLKNLKTALRSELSIQSDLLRLKGSLEVVLSSNTIATVSHHV